MIKSLDEENWGQEIKRIYYSFGHKKLPNICVYKWKKNFNLLDLAFNLR